jgi:hypothetical protein
MLTEARIFLSSSTSAIFAMESVQNVAGLV